MAILIIRHKVQNYDTWKKAFDAHATTRRTAGSKGGTLYHTHQNPGEVIAVIEWESVDKARTFAQSEDLRKVMAQAGVVGTPEIHFLEERETFSV